MRKIRKVLFTLFLSFGTLVPDCCTPSTWPTPNPVPRPPECDKRATDCH